MPVVVILGPFSIVKPLVFTLVLPVVTEPSSPKLTSLASLTINVSSPFITTPILLSVNVIVSAPPLIFKVSSNLRVSFVPASSAKLSPPFFRSVTSVLKLSISV